MALEPGSRLGRYEIVGTVGSGGMGIVYKAKDSRLGRTVALKLLPEPLDPTPEQRERFEREARAISQLNHPHICTLHDFGSHDGIDFLVMEYLDGETLAERLRQGALAPSEALKTAIQICDALDAAHSVAITHRDLKPGNIMLTRTGVKLLDFGLAKTHVIIGTMNTNSSTLSMKSPQGTLPGSIIGTFQYMAPEQLEGKEADARTDIFAFGAVLYEMLTGRKAFSAESQASLIAAILDTEPPLPLDPLGEVLKRCLAKSPADRWQNIRDVSAFLSWIGKADGKRSRVSKRTWVASLASALVLGAVAGTAVWLLRPEPARPVVRLSVDLPSETFLGGGIREERVVGGSRPSQTSLAVSPDGRVLFFSAVGSDGAHLFRRRLGEHDSVKIEGTLGAVGPAFSPDGAFVTFWSAGELKKVALEGGLPVSLCKTPLTFGTTWGPDGRIVFGREADGLWQVKATGGEPEALTTLAPERGEQSHRLPHFLPNGRGLLFTVIKSQRRSEDDEVVLQDLRTGERQVLARGGADARYAASGHVLYAREGVLMAMPFDLERMKPTGAPTPALSSVMQAFHATNSRIETRAAQLSLSSDGTLVYGEGGGHPVEERHLLWVDRTGREEPAPLPSAPWFSPRVSPDRAFVALYRPDSGVWIYDLLRDTTTRLTFKGDASYVQLSPDGREVAFLWENGDSPPGIFVQATDGSGSPTRLSTGLHFPSSWSPDGKVIAFVSDVPDRDIWMLTLPERRVEALTRTPFLEQSPMFSPDGRWLAYTSNESGPNEVYVTAFPNPGAKYKISTDGGHSPAWARTGRELFYLHANLPAGRYVQDFMAVDVSSSAQFSASRPHRLFQRLTSVLSPTTGYDVSADGRFLILTPYDPPTEKVTRLQVVLNWFEELKRLAPTQ